MKTAGITYTLLWLLFLTGPVQFAQDGTNQVDDAQKSSYLTAGVHFINDAVFLGRKDSVTAPYLYTTLEYQNKSGFYTKGSASYLTKSDEGRFDLFLLAAGYRFDTNRWNGDFSATKYFFNDDSYTVLSAVEADITGQLVYDATYMNIGVVSSLFFNSSGSSDFILIPMLSHDFISQNRQFQISPSVSFQFGSQKFYQEYYREMVKKNSGSGTGSGSGSGGSSGDSGETEIVVEVNENESFSLLAIELDLPIWYIQKPFTFSFIPTYAIPLNPADIYIDNQLVQEDIEPSFYWIIGLTYTF